MPSEAHGGIRLRPATPEDLPVLELWEREGAAEPRPPYVAVTLAAFEKESGRGTLLVVEDGGTEAGCVVLARLWSNRLRGEVLVLDDMHLDSGIDEDLVLHEVRRFAREAGVETLLVRDREGRLTTVD